MNSTRQRAEIEVLADSSAAAGAAAEWIADRIASTSDVFRMALSGGNTPRLLYSELASERLRGRIEWSRIELFWGDERFVPHTAAKSNYRMARETLLARVPVLIDNVHPIPTDGDPATAAGRYEMLLKGIYGADMLSPARPLFDLVLLGLGPDGHTASLFPGSPVLMEREHWVAPVLGQEEPRITLTYPALEATRATLFLVTGSDKADAVRRVQDADGNLPAARLRGPGATVWFLDRAAAGEPAETA